MDRSYLPAVEARRYGLPNLSIAAVRADRGAFRLFIQAQVSRFETWQRQAEQGFAYLPKRVRVPVEVATKLHAWTARAIGADPLAVFEQDIRPPPHVVLRETARSFV